MGVTQSFAFLPLVFWVEKSETGYVLQGRPTDFFLSGVEPVVPPRQTPVLYQNYPNPFNPSTSMNYFLPRREHVTIQIFDMLGRTIATLVDGPIEPGDHMVSWNATGFPSGVYFCRLRTDTHQMNRKLLLVR